MKNIFEIFSTKRIVGVDIGTSAIKIVEVSGRGNGKKLENYGQINAGFSSKGGSSQSKLGYNTLSSSVSSLAIKEILERARIKTKAAIFAIPDFSTFCTSFEIPPMPEKEIEGAVRYNASQYLTLPISDVTLDWKIISDIKPNNKSPLKVFIVAVPNQIISEYQKIAKDAGLDLYALEAEVFGITSSLIKDNKKTVCLVDIGVQSSTLNIIDQGFLKRSYSFNFSSNQLTQAISSDLGVNYFEAEEIKIKEGLLSEKDGVAQALRPVIDSLLAEVRDIAVDFLHSDQREIEEFYLTGGTANLLGLKYYCSKGLSKEVYVPTCFSDFSYPKILEKTLSEMAPSFSVAVGVALDGLKI